MYVDPGEGAGQPLGMTVTPDKLVRLMEGIETEHARLQNWLRTNSMQLVEMAAPGGDPCSADTVAVFAENGNQAIAMAEAYITQLSNVITELRSAAKDYGLIEDDNIDNFRQVDE